MQQSFGQTKGRVIFLLGIMPRSGTNFLCELLCRHPDCGTTFHITEDFLLANAHHLSNFADGVHGSWNLLWGDFDTSLKSPLLQAVGQGLEDYLYEQTSETWLKAHQESDEWPPTVKVRPAVRIARTPSVENLALLPQLTDAKTVVIVRDGRSVVESGMRSFGWWFEDAVQRWAKEADQIASVTEAHAQVCYVRYEDLLVNRPGELHTLFSFIGVNPQTYNYKTEIPIRGSSTFFDNKKGINWQDTKPTPAFNPLNRWQHWSKRRKIRFDWVAAQQMRAFGYPAESNITGFWLIYNHLLDFIWPLRARMRDLGRRLIPTKIRARVMWSRGKLYRRLIPRPDKPNPKGVMN